MGNSQTNVRGLWRENAQLKAAMDAQADGFNRRIAGLDNSLANTASQRDELLAALEACVDALDRIKEKYGVETSAEIAGRTAIASVKGGA